MITFTLGSLLAYGTPDAFFEASKAEIERAMTLELPNQPKPHWIQIHGIDERRHTIIAQMGAIQINAPRHVRIARVDLRVGTPQLDNTNFQTFGSQDGLTIKRLPTSDNVLALRRELWLALDSAYKGATEQYSLKLAALEGHPPPEGPDLLAAPVVTDIIPFESLIQAEAIQAWIQNLSAPYRNPGLFEEFNVAFRQVEKQHTIVSSEGTMVHFPERYSVLVVEAVRRSEDGEKHSSLRSWVVQDPTSLTEQAETTQAVNRFTDWLIDLEKAPQEPDYLGPVIFEEAASAELFRQLLPPEISGTPPESEAPDGFGALPKPIASSRVGRRLLPLGWSVQDLTQSETGQVGHYQYDYEGIPVRDVKLVEDGVVRDLLMTRVPREGFKESTGHGRSSNFRRHVARPGVIEIRPNKHTSNRRLRKIAIRMAKQTGKEYVLVVKQLTPLPLENEFEIAFSGDGPLAGLTQANEIYRLYADGHTEPVHSMKFIGVDRRVMRDIIAAGQQSEWIGMLDEDPSAGRHGMGAFTGTPVSWSAPTILIGELELHTQSSHEQKIIPPPLTD